MLRKSTATTCRANQRYYKWISKDNENAHYIYVNFSGEGSRAFITVSAYNTSGFSGKEAIEKYLDTVKAEVS